MGRLRRWLSEPGTNTYCPVCGRGVAVPHTFSGVGGIWSVPVSRPEVVAACRVQNGTSHRDDDPPEPGRDARLPSLAREAAVGFGVGTLLLVGGVIAASWALALLGGVFIAGTAGYLRTRSKREMQ